jgi:hypothetical protein
MSWILKDYRNLLEARLEEKITYEEFKREKEKLKEKYRIKGFYLDGIVVEEPIKISEILKNLKRDVLEMCPDAKIEDDTGKWVLKTSSGKTLLSGIGTEPTSVTIRFGRYSIYLTSNGFSEENIVGLLDETCSKILDLLAEKYYGLKRP